MLGTRCFAMKCTVGFFSDGGLLGVVALIAVALTSAVFSDLADSHVAVNVS